MQQFTFQLKGWIIGFVFDSEDERDKARAEVLKTFLLLEQDGSVQRGTFNGEPLLALIGVRPISFDRREQYRNICSKGRYVSYSLDDETILKLAIHHEFGRFFPTDHEVLART